jgi:hypothetical protein
MLYEINFLLNQTYHSYIRKIGFLVLVGDIIAVYLEIIRNTNTLCHQNRKFLMLQKVAHVITIKCQRTDDVRSAAFVIFG